MFDSPLQRVIGLPARRTTDGQGADQLRKAMTVPVVRFEPGDQVPWDGTYALVHEWGEPSGFSISCCRGARLPLVAVADDGPHWYVLVIMPDEIAKAA